MDKVLLNPTSAMLPRITQAAKQLYDSSIRGLGPVTVRLGDIQYALKDDPEKLILKLKELDRSGYESIFFQAVNNQIDPRAIKIFRQLCVDSNDEVRALAKSIICKFYRQEVAMNPTIATKRKQLYNSVCDYLTATSSEEAKEAKGIETITKAGVLFTKKGEDCIYTEPDPNAPMEEDSSILRLGEPLPRCYSAMKETVIGSLVYDLLNSEEEGFRDLNLWAYENLLELNPDSRLIEGGKAIQLAALRKHLTEVGLLSANAGIYQFWEGTFRPVTLSSNENERNAEIDFLRTCGLNEGEAVDFNFTFQKMIQNLFLADDNAAANGLKPRAIAVRDFIIGYSLLSFKAQRIQASANYSDYVLKAFSYPLTSSERETAISDINQQMTLMGKLMCEGARLDKSGRVHKLFGELVNKNLGQVLTHLGLSTFAQTEELVRAQMKAISIDMNAQNFNRATPMIRLQVKDADGLVQTISKAPETAAEYRLYQKDLATREKGILGIIKTRFFGTKNQTLIDHQQVDNFFVAWEGHLKTFLESEEAWTVSTVGTLVNADNYEPVISDRDGKPLPNPENVRREFIRFLNDSSSPSAVRYVANNWDLIFNQAQDQIVFPKVDTRDTYGDACKAAVLTKKKSEGTIGSPMQAAIESGRAASVLTGLQGLDEESAKGSVSDGKLAIISIIRRRDNQDEASTVSNRQSFVSNFLNARIKEGEAVKAHGDKHLVGVLEILRDLHSNLATNVIDQNTFNQAREFIYINCLGLRQAEYTTLAADVASEGQFLDQLLGTELRDPTVMFGTDLRRKGLDDNSLGNFAKLAFTSAMSTSVERSLELAIQRAKDGAAQNLEQVMSMLFKNAQLDGDPVAMAKSFQTAIDGIDATQLEKIEDPEARAATREGLIKDIQNKLPGLSKTVLSLTKDQRETEIYLGSLVENQESLDLLSYFYEMISDLLKKFLGDNNSNPRVEVLANRSTDMGKVAGRTGTDTMSA